jgi:hypothetical protein
VGSITERFRSAIWQALRESQVLAARTIVQHAIARGELPQETSVTILLDALCGAVTMHIQATPRHLHDQLTESVDRYIDELVAFLLAAVAARQETVAPAPTR